LNRNSENNLQQNQDKRDHEDHGKNMSFHKGALHQRLKTTDTSVNTSLVVFCNLRKPTIKRPKGLLNIVKKPILAIILMKTPSNVQGQGF
jgi:hypothetical protein